MPTKYIFVTGGVVSSIGKGITTASLGRLLKSRGYKVSMQKFDPYINADPGMMSPYQHGEVFVTDDGTETDLDLGHYERFIDESLTGFSSITTGKIYWHVLQRERRGDYQGGTIQVVPHITNEIKTCIRALETVGNPDVIIAEIGGTVGDIESLPYLEAIRQFRWEVGAENVAFIHVTLLPYISASGELKTKPTQHSVKELLSIGIQPDILVVRSESEVSDELKEKIALFCNVYKNCVIQNLDCDTLYEVPLLLEREGLDRAVLERLHLKDTPPQLDEWRSMVERIRNPAHNVTIALVGDYVELKDAYLSVTEALVHAGVENDARVDVRYIQSESLNDSNAAAILEDADGILVPGGVSDKGVEGKLSAIKFARERERPFFGICFGMQLAVIEFARNIPGLERVAKAAVDPDARDLVIYLPPALRDDAQQGAAARIGRYGCTLKPDTRAARAYGVDHISERHQHSYELNNSYIQHLSEAGMQVAGVNEEKNLAEIVEIPSHPWYVGVQFHPEFRSRPNRAHPLFGAFIKAALDGKEQ